MYCIQFVPKLCEAWYTRAGQQYVIMLYADDIGYL